MLLYYHSWMFYNHFIATLYHFLGQTYWPSAQCQLLFFGCFLHRRKSISNRVQTQRNFLENFFGPEKDTGWAKEVPKREPEVSTKGAPWWAVPTSVASWTASLLYKYPNIPETLGDSTKFYSSSCRVQNHQIQSRHHLGGVHHVHWCLSDDAWVVLCRPAGP